MMPRSLGAVLVALVLTAWCVHAVQPDKAAAQKDGARANWKKAFGKDEPPHVETAHFLIYGKVAGKELKDVAQTLEQQFDLARKALELGDEAAWTGKLAVYLLEDRDQFKLFLRRVERRLAEAEDVASLKREGDNPHVVASLSKEKLDFGVDGLVGEQIAAALLIKKAGGAQPEWLLEGFGRATVLQTAAKNDQAAEHGKAKHRLTTKKIMARDVYAGNLPAVDAVVLRGSLAEYLAYSGKTQIFPQFVAALRPRGENLDQFPSVEDALKAVNVSPDQLNAKWQGWVKFTP